MIIDLDRFNKVEVKTLPVVNHLLVFNGRKQSLPSIEDGWYKVKVSAEKMSPGEPADALDREEVFEVCSIIDGFVYGNSIVPLSFNTVLRKYNFESSHLKVYGMTAEPWSPVRCIVWEDFSIHYWKFFPIKTHEVLTRVQEAFSSRDSIETLSGVTPEMCYLYTLFTLQRDTLDEMKKIEDLQLAEDEKKKLREEFERTFAGRLVKSFESAGGHVKDFTEDSRGNLIVNWTIRGEDFNSVVRPDLSIYEAGYCMENDDRRHTVSSMVLTAKDYSSQGLIYKTRR